MIIVPVIIVAGHRSSDISYESAVNAHTLTIQWPIDIVLNISLIAIVRSILMIITVTVVVAICVIVGVIIVIVIVIVIVADVLSANNIVVGSSQHHRHARRRCRCRSRCSPLPSTVSYLPTGLRPSTLALLHTLPRRSSDLRLRQTNHPDRPSSPPQLSSPGHGHGHWFVVLSLVVPRRWFACWTLVLHAAMYLRRQAHAHFRIEV